MMVSLPMHIYVTRPQQVNEYNFRPYITTWVTILDTDIESSMVTNGYTSGAFLVSRRVWQGCPLSPCLLMLWAESMATVMRNEKHIRGIPVNNIQNEKMIHADYTNMITTRNKGDLKTTVEVFRKVYHISGTHFTDMDKLKSQHG